MYIHKSAPEPNLLSWKRKQRHGEFYITGSLLAYSELKVLVVKTLQCWELNHIATGYPV